MSPVDAAIHIEHCAYKTGRHQSIYISLPVLLVLTCCYNHVSNSKSMEMLTWKEKRSKRRRKRFAKGYLLIYWGHILWISSHIVWASYRVWSSVDKDISRSFATKRKLPQKGGGGSKPVTIHMICWPTISYFMRLPPFIFLFLSPTAECMCHFGETYVQIAI